MLWQILKQNCTYDMFTLTGLPIVSLISLLRSDNVSNQVANRAIQCTQCYDIPHLCKIGVNNWTLIVFLCIIGAITTWQVQLNVLSMAKKGAQLVAKPRPWKLLWLWRKFSACHTWHHFKQSMIVLPTQNRGRLNFVRHEKHNGVGLEYPRHTDRTATLRKYCSLM